MLDLKNSKEFFFNRKKIKIGSNYNKKIKILKTYRVLLNSYIYNPSYINFKTKYI